ncbi:hypothetical protein Lal_00027078 [Lupinus albus]|nr:hypothetical protein Lal_00027078 [Lupinus albus]
MKEALKMMHNDKVVRPNDVTLEAWKDIGEQDISWLTNLFNNIIRYVNHKNKTNGLGLGHHSLGKAYDNVHREHQI